MDYSSLILFLFYSKLIDINFVWIHRNFHFHKQLEHWNQSDLEYSALVFLPIFQRIKVLCVSCVIYIIICCNHIILLCFHFYCLINQSRATADTRLEV